MLCYIYRSAKKLDTYLYLQSKDKLDALPEGLQKLLGRLDFVMQLDLSARERLENAEIEEVKKCLRDEGFYLQLPREQHIDV